MANIFEEMAKIKRAIDSIEEPLSPNSTGLNDITKSQQIFVDSALLPDGFEVSQSDFASPEALGDYSDKVLQAVWNIAHYSSGGYIKALFNNSTIRESFAFLDSTCWVPKIVDANTLSVGKALQGFLFEALKPESLAELPTEGLRISAEKFFKRAQTILNKRIEIYEIHRPEHLAESIKWINYKNERLARLKEAEANYHEKMTGIKNDLALVRDGIEMNSHILEQKLLGLEELRARYEVVTEEYRNYGKQWHEENKEKEIPDTVSASDLIYCLANKDTPANITEHSWRTLYNDQDYRIYSEKITATLTKDYNGVSDLISDNEMVISGVLGGLKIFLEECKEDAALFEGFEAELQKAVTDIPEISISDDLQLLSCSEEQPLSASINSYSNAIQQIEGHKANLLKQHQQLVTKEEEFGARISLLALKDPEGKSFFERAITVAFQTRIEAVNQQLKTAEDLIHKAKRELRVAEDKLASESLDGRGASLAEATARIAQTFQKHHTISRSRLVSQNIKSDQFNQEYTHALKMINDQYEPEILSADNNLSGTGQHISAKQEVLNELRVKEQERKDFLKVAGQELANYKRVIQEHTGIYLPVSSVPGDKLKTYLECDASMAGFIDGMYDIEKAASSWYGINRANFANKLSHYISVITPSEFDYDIDSVIEYITAKIESIKTELRIDVTSGDTLSEKSKTDVLNEGNLWSIQKQIKQVTEELSQLEELRQTEEELVKKIRAEKSRKISEWVIKKSETEYEQAIIQLEHDINIFDHGLAMVALDGYQLEYKIADIENGQKILDEFFKELETKSDEEALKYLTELENQIATLDVNSLMLKKSNYKEASGSELLKKIQDSLDAREKELKQIVAMEETISKIPEALKSRMEGIELELQELLDKKIRLEGGLEHTKRVNLEKTHIIQEKKLALIALITENVSHKITQPEPLLDSMDNTGNIGNESGKHISGKEPGQDIFAAYLQERAQQFWFKDLFRSIAAFAFGCFGYKTDGQERQEFIDEQLRPAIREYEQSNDSDELLRVIQYGQNYFPPRAEGEQHGYTNSLHYKLELLKREITPELEGNAQYNPRRPY